MGGTGGNRRICVCGLIKRLICDTRTAPKFVRVPVASKTCVMGMNAGSAGMMLWSVRCCFE